MKCKNTKFWNFSFLIRIHILFPFRVAKQQNPHVLHTEHPVKNKRSGFPHDSLMISSWFPHGSWFPQDSLGKSRWFSRGREGIPTVYGWFSNFGQIYQIIGSLREAVTSRIVGATSKLNTFLTSTWLAQTIATRHVAWICKTAKSARAHT